MRIAAPVSALLFAAALSAQTLVSPALADMSPTPGTIDVQGIGEVVAKPDMAYITSGVVAQAATARDALDANTEAMNKLIDVLVNAGIEERDIQTSNFSVQPQYVYSDERDENGYTKAPRITGYQVSNSLSVRVRDLENLGAVLDEAVSVGANTIENVTFGVDETGDLYAEARKRAVADAIAKANLYAVSAGVAVGRLLSISEQQNFEPKYGGAPMRAMTEAVDSSVPVQGGELTFSITANMRWEIAQ